MLNIKLLRKDPTSYESLLKTKEPSLNLASILILDKRILTIISKLTSLLALRDSLSKKIGEQKRLKKDTHQLMQEVSDIGDTISTGIISMPSVSYKCQKGCKCYVSNT
jgi:seryl-tRNA synthetase